MKHTNKIGQKLTVFQQNKRTIYQKKIFDYIILVECLDGFYGMDCNDQCGHCVHKEMCDNRNGSCYNGCEPYFDGARCDSKCRWIFSTWKILIFIKSKFHQPFH